jgi:protein tyrosine/serine phosphatase
MSKLSSSFLLTITFLLGSGLSSAQTAPDGVANFHKVNIQVYRGAQPTDRGFLNLAKLGVKTVIDLREADGHTLIEKKAVEAAGMHFINIPMRGLGAPTPEQVSKVLTLFNDESAGPVFVHCKRGADRTGTVVACYRIAHDHWDNQAALKEARSFGMSWMERAMQNYVRRFKPDASVAVNPVITPALAVNP